MGRELIHADLSQEIIGTAMEVLNELKPGLDEKLYENALVIELRNRGRKVEQQKRFSVHYKGISSAHLFQISLSMNSSWSIQKL